MLSKHAGHHLIRPSANAEAIYARSNILLLTQSVRVESAGQSGIHVVAMIVTQEKVIEGKDHIITGKIKGRPAETR